MKINHDIKSAIEGNYEIPDEKVKQMIEQLKTVHNFYMTISLVDKPPKTLSGMFFYFYIMQLLSV
jgi:hypothetical protein